MLRLQIGTELILDRLEGGLELVQGCALKTDCFIVLEKLTVEIIHVVHALFSYQFFHLREHRLVLLVQRAFIQAEMLMVQVQPLVLLVDLRCQGLTERFNLLVEVHDLLALGFWRGFELGLIEIVVRRLKGLCRLFQTTKERISGLSWHFFLGCIASFLLALVHLSEAFLAEVEICLTSSIAIVRGICSEDNLEARMFRAVLA